jgi:photosystem II stability/assembly factor-like uncharacterized protein
MILKLFKTSLSVIIFILFHIDYVYCQSDWKLLYSENFESGITSDWELNGAWRVENSENNYILIGETHDWATYLNGYRWTDYSFKSKVNVKLGTLHLNFRYHTQARYFFGFNPDGWCSVQKELNGEIRELDGAIFGFSRDVWYAIEIICTGDTVKVLVNDILIFNLTDTLPKTSGTIVLESSENSFVLVDDIEVTGKLVPPLPPGYLWQKTGGPPGGVGYDVRIHPLNKDIMFVTDNPSGVNKSYDGGRTWFQRNSGIDAKTGGSGDGIPIFTITIDPNNPDIVWSGTQDQRGIFKSTDHGESWTRKDNGITENNITFRGIAVCPGNSDIVLAAAEVGTGVLGVEFEKIKGVIYKTVDGGENWNPVWNGNNLARVLIYNPVNPQIVYCSTGIFDREAYDSDFETGKPGGVGMLKSTDGGESWFTINNGLDNMYLGFLEMHPIDPEVLYTIGYNVTYDLQQPSASVYKTTNGGENWEKVLATNHGLTVVVISKSDPETIYAGSLTAFFRSKNGGDTWQMIEGWGPPGIVPGFPIGGVTDPNDPDKIFLNNYTGGNFLSLDGGTTWSNSSNGYTGANVKDVFINPQDDAMIYVAANSGPFSSSDGGTSWTGLKYEFAPGPSCITCFPDNPSEVLAADEVHGYMSKSIDGGKGWKIVFPHPNPAADTNPNWHGFNSIIIAPSSPNIVYAGMRKGSSSPNPSYGIFKSEDRGETWRAINNGLDSSVRAINVIAVHPINPDIAYAGTILDGIYKTIDGGESWQRMSDGLGCSDVRSIAINPHNPEVLFAGSGEGTGIYKSINGGVLWGETNKGISLQCPSYLKSIGGTVAGFSTDKPINVFRQYSEYIPWTKIMDIVIDPQNTKRILAADLNTGMYLSQDEGSSWYQINDGLRYRGVTSLTISSEGDIVYAGTDGNGVYRMVLCENMAPQILYSIPTNIDTLSLAVIDSLDFFIHAFDLDGDTLSYRWLVDQNRIPDEDTSSYRFIANEFTLGYHYLNSEVADKDTMVTINWIINIIIPSNIDNSIQDTKNSFSISQIYPNPFNSHTIIKYNIPDKGRVKLDIYSVMGQKVKTLVDQDLIPTMNFTIWDGKNEMNRRVSNGIYICRIEFNTGSKSYIQEKMIILIQYVIKNFDNIGSLMGKKNNKLFKKLAENDQQIP